MDIKQAVKLWRLINNPSAVMESGWVGSEFYVWIHHADICDFVEKLKRILGENILDDDEIGCVLKNNCMCLNLTQIDVDNYLPDIFPVGEFRH